MMILIKITNLIIKIILEICFTFIETLKLAENAMLHNRVQIDEIMKQTRSRTNLVYGAKKSSMRFYKYNTISSLFQNFVSNRYFKNPIYNMTFAFQLYPFNSYAFCIEKWEFVKQLLRVFHYKYISINWFLNQYGEPIYRPFQLNIILNEIKRTMKLYTNTNLWHWHIDMNYNLRK